MSAASYAAGRRGASHMRHDRAPFPPIARIIHIMAPRISLIALGVSDLERSLRFYRDGLGLPTTWTPDKGVIFFKTTGVCLALYPLDELAKDALIDPLAHRSPWTGIALAHNVRIKEDVDRILATAEGAGGKIQK